MSQPDTMVRMEEKRAFEGNTGHGQGMGSRSGAWLWLSGSSSSLAPVPAAGGEGKVQGRKYHISAEDSSQPTNTTSRDVFLALNPSGSGEVDLDLSFDFVSQFEANRTQQQTPQKNNNDAVTVVAAPINESPRGISTARWASRPRKQPPSALFLHNKKKSMNVDLTSQFSPISPLDGRDDNMQSLVITPLSSTRRAFDAGIEPNMEQNTASKSELVRQQRLAAKQKQNDQQIQRLLPDKVKRSAPFGFDYKAQANTSPVHKAALGENKARGNKQMVPTIEQGDLFDEESYDYKKHLKKSASVASTRTGGAVSSFATAYESQGAKTKRSKRQKGSVESVNTFDTAMTRETSDVPSIDVHPPLASDNMLGLNFTGSKTSGALGLHQINQVESPQSTQNSSPDTPFSALFSESDTTRGSEYTHGTMSEGSRTPGTAFSTLFDERVLDVKSTDSAQMTRGNTAPLLKEVILEEDVSAKQIRTAPAASFLVDLPGTDKALPASRHRQVTDNSTSDYESSPMEANQTMILSTKSSPVEEVEFLFRKPSQAKTFEEKRQVSGARAGPWPQSPLLLTNFIEGDVSEELKGALGLGIDMGRAEEVHLERDTSETSVERALSPIDNGSALGLDLGTMPVKGAAASSTKDVVQTESLLPPAKEAVIRKSPSFVSSVDGFAINVTPAVEGQPDHKIDVPSNSADEEVEETEKVESQSRGRWSSKLWSMASKSPLSAFRSPTQSRFEENQSPPMRTLTLISKRGEDGDQAGQKRYRSHSRDDARRSLRVEEDGYHSMPSSAVLPTAETFAPLQAPAQALYSQPRSSRHVKRSSRIHYVPTSDHVHVDMTSPQGNASQFDDLKSPRIAQSPSGFTPKMEYLMNAKNNRHSWDYSNPSDQNRTPTWLAPKRQSITFQRDSDIYLTLRNSTLSAVAPEKEDLTAQQMMETIVEDGIRRRANHRGTNSVPSTPSMVPETWTSHLPDSQQSQQEENPTYKGQGLHFQAVQKSIERENYRPRTMMSMSIFGSAAIAPYLTGLTGSRNRSKMVQSTGAKPATYYKSSNRMSLALFTDNRGGPEGIIAYSGRALESASPSRALFFAGFLGMPWLWFIGGWALEDNGSIYVERERLWEEWNEEAILRDVLGKEAVGPIAVQASSPNVHASHPSIHRRSLQETQYGQDGDMVYSMGKPESIINMEEEYQAQRDLHTAEAPRHRSIDLTGEEDHQSGIAYSTEGDHAVYSHGNSKEALPASQWEEYDDKKGKQLKKKTFFQQVFEANTTMLTRLTSSTSHRSSTSSLSALKKRQQNNINNQQSVQSSSLAGAFTSWKKLEAFVLWNRIMALLVSIGVFGAFAVAIAFVINDW